MVSEDCMLLLHHCKNQEIIRLNPICLSPSVHGMYNAVKAVVYEYWCFYRNQSTTQVLLTGKLKKIGLTLSDDFPEEWMSLGWRVHLGWHCVSSNVCKIHAGGRAEGELQLNLPTEGGRVWHSENRFWNTDLGL